MKMRTVLYVLLALTLLTGGCSSSQPAGTASPADVARFAPALYSTVAYAGDTLYFLSSSGSSRLYAYDGERVAEIRCPEGVSPSLLGSYDGELYFYGGGTQYMRLTGGGEFEAVCSLESSADDAFYMTDPLLVQDAYMTGRYLYVFSLNRLWRYDLEEGGVTGMEVEGGGNQLAAIADNTAYYCDTKNHRAIAVDLNTGSNRALFDGTFTSFAVCDSKVYYSDYANDGAFVCCNLDGSDPSPVAGADGALYFVPSAGELYLHGKREIYRCADGRAEQIASFEADISYPTACERYIVFSARKPLECDRDVSLNIAHVEPEQVEVTIYTYAYDLSSGELALLLTEERAAFI